MHGACFFSDSHAFQNSRCAYLPTSEEEEETLFGVGYLVREPSKASENMPGCYPLKPNKGKYTMSQRLPSQNRKKQGAAGTTE